ncbi:hypothetical protein GCM10009867_26200 [Pedococcus aerophilus]|uniref:Uncharacterized protein n=1 Tax=Pedococcus aerophilus TaxID=436356 RepID=A0ABP6H6Y0_9MICO
MGELDPLGPPRDRHPGRVTGQPQADLDAARRRGGSHGQRLVEAFDRRGVRPGVGVAAGGGGVRGAAGGLDHEAGTRSGHGPQATIWCVHYFYIGLLVASAVVITWFAGFVVYRLVKTPR